MSNEQKFFICKHCGNLAGLINNEGVPMICCGDEMTELKPNTVEASAEKHLPVVSVSGEKITVEVGSVPHPAQDAHHIAFVYLETEQGGQRKRLRAGVNPTVVFSLADDKPIAAYAYCNLHGLWKTEI